MNNLSSYYGLNDSRMSASEIDLPVSIFLEGRSFYGCSILSRSITDKSLSEALILASTNPQYAGRLFIDVV